MPYTLRALTSGIQGPGIEGFLNLVYPLTELIEVDVKTRHFVLLEGGFGGRGEFLPCFLLLNVFRDGVCHQRVRRAPFCRR